MSPSAALGGEAATLSRELADFLVELSIALHKNAIYPPGHPLLEGAVAGIERRLRAVLSGAERGTLSLGVARHQLVIEGVATDPEHPLLRELAARLHRHQLGAVRFGAGVTRGELADFLRTVAAEVSRTGRPLGLEGPDVLLQWPHVALYALTYERLELLDESADPAQAAERDREAATRAAQLWIGLARAALASEVVAPNEPAAGGGDPEAHDPMVVARAIDEHARDQAYDQVVVGYLLQIADELKAKQGQEAAALQRRISRLVAALRPETLRRLLEMGGDDAQRRRFVLDAAEGMAADAVVELVQAAADTSHQTVSHSMLRLLSKFAVHAERGARAARPEFDVALRDQVRQLLAEWRLDDPNPDAYRAALEGMARAAPARDEPAAGSFPPEPERMVQMALEVGSTGEPLWRAADALLARGALPRLLDLLDRAPDDDATRGARELLWARVATQERLREAAAAEPLDAPLLERLVRRLGLAAAGALLDAAEAASEAAAEGGAEARRLRVVSDLLVSLGPDAGPLVAARTHGARWGALRTLLGVLGRLPELPAGWMPRTFVHHPDAEVRRAAFRILLRDGASAAQREAALGAALADPDERIVSAALSAAVSGGCPRAAVPALVRKAEDLALAPELRALALRALGTVRDPALLGWLWARVAMKKGLAKRTRLLPKSPEMLATLAALSAGWRGYAAADELLDLARASSDPEIRAAAAVRQRTTTETKAMRE
ncbi:MAG TPA: hypothetical protein VKA84_27355 [Gemmatimonadaceae bacterium]|nr:hypothetical protein [Gemmatimonadaceae bacterium]